MIRHCYESPLTSVVRKKSYYCRLLIAFSESLIYKGLSKVDAG